MHSYLVTMLDRMTGSECRVVVQAECPHDMQEFVDRLAREGKLPISSPVVVDIDDRAAAHVPLVNPAKL
ncbi:hypothetical protein SEA_PHRAPPUCCINO_59 [Mycobacterium phage Phrappuccino]|uniref:Uncharacterized protein n=1 Tax=Mycobacterium phage Phrappuccino TaxID=2591223 RepID=A0A514DDQ3_9CAUD|nr:hypothetical protein KHQ87_gp059 [Mycobacterium phage Phrappuccino]QDH91734.1 hypothetical protein SEA_PHRAPPUCCINO_59 [Mycobacterium phage Phrappuccino]QIQ63177.1 hypothetical protein SEA_SETTECANDELA_59 [Mycobacterium phage Settecandela]